MVAVLSVHEHVRFFAFCVFELTLGVYFPGVGVLKSRIVEDESRGFTYALMRMPLNVFVMAILCTTDEGEPCASKHLRDSTDTIQMTRIVSSGSSFARCWRCPPPYCCNSCGRRIDAACDGGDEYKGMYWAQSLSQRYRNSTAQHDS